MPKDYTDQQIAERIAERRARTQELKKKHHRTMIVQICLTALALALLVLLIVFLVHALSGRSSKTAQPPQEPAATEEQLQTEVPPVEDAPAKPAEPPAEQAPPAPTADEEPDEPDELDEPENTIPEIAPGRYADTVIFVDPGRGYSDLGCGSDYLKDATERDVNLAVAKRVAALLGDYGFSAVLTHDTNEIPTGEAEDYVLDQLTRVSMANTGGCDLYLSLHCDNFPDNPKAAGPRLYYCTDVDGSGAYADAIAVAMQEKFGSAPKIAGYDTENAFIVTSQIAAPSVLVEMGFVTNETDASLMLNDEWQARMAQALTAGVITYFEENIKAE